MTVEKTQIGDTTVLRVAGRMDAESAPRFQQACETCVSEGHTKLVIDLSRLVYISSMGLRGFVAVNELLRTKGGDLRLCGVTGLVRQVFEITSLNRIFPMHDSVESALANA